MTTAKDASQVTSKDLEQTFALPLMLQEVRAIKLEEGKKEAADAFEVTLKAVVTDSTLAWIGQSLKGHVLMVVVTLPSGC